MVPATEYQESPFQGFLKRTRIGSTVLFNLEFHLTHVAENVEVSEVLRNSISTSAQHHTSHSTTAHSKTRRVELRPPTKLIPWTTEEGETVLKMKEEDGCSWGEISDALPSPTLGAIQVPYCTKLASGTGSRNVNGHRGFGAQRLYL